MPYLPLAAIDDRLVAEKPASTDNKLVAEEQAKPIPVSYKPPIPEIPKEFLATAPADSRAEKKKAPKFVPQEPIKKETRLVPMEECWRHLRSERDNLLKATDYVNTGVVPLTLEERAQLYNYRKELRELPNLKGAPWTPDTIPWPTRPQTR